MVAEIFAIKSLFLQNAVMFLSMATVVFFLGRALLKKNVRQAVAFFGWSVAILWFFNSPFFGFSEISVRPEGIGLNYGFCSFRNAVLPLESTWEVETHMSGLRKTKRLYLLRVDGHRSMKVQGADGLRLLEEIGTAIDRARKGPQ